MSAFDNLRAKIMHTVTQFEEKLAKFVTKNLKSEENMDGLLTCSEANYQIDIVRKKIESTLKLDENFWKLNLELYENYINSQDE